MTVQGDIEDWLLDEIAVRTGRRPSPPFRDASFEELGLDSLASIEIAAALAAQVGRDLPQEILFERPTIGDLLTELEREVAEPRKELPACPEDVPFELTEIQWAYWVGRTGFVALGDVSCHFYAEIEVEDIDLQRLEAALDRLVERHDALRIVIDDKGRQRVLSVVPACKVEVVDLSRVEDFEGACLRERERISHEVRPADRWPLFCWRLLERREGCGVLQVSYDLLIADAASLLILTDELVRLYAEPAAELEPLGVTFAQCAVSKPPPEALERAREYWRGRLGEIPDPPALPFATAPEDLESQRFARLAETIGEELWTRVRERAREAGLTPAVALAAAYAAALGEWSESSRFTLNVTVYRRPPIHPDVHGVVGDFTTFDLLTVELDDRIAFEDVARTMKQRLRQDTANIHGAGVGLLRELSERRGEPFFAPVVFTSLLGFEGRSHGSSFEAFGRRRFTSTQTPQVWIDHQALAVADGVELSWDFVEGLFRRADVEAAFARYVELVTALADSAAWSMPLAVLLEGLEEPLPSSRRAGAEDPLLEEMRQLVSDTLGLGDLDVDAELLASGATSLELIQLGGQLERRYGVRPRTRDLYRVGTIRGLAGFYRELLDRDAAATPAIAASAADRAEVRASSFPDPAEASEVVELGGPGRSAAGRERRSCRSFDGAPLSLDELSSWFGALASRFDGKRRYPSAGAAYAVRAFVHVPGAGVEGLAPGVYLYHPQEHVLVALGGDPALDRSVHWPSNREIYDRAGVGIFLVGDLDGIEPLYGELAHEFCLIEAGAMMQLLMEAAAEAGLGSCPIGGLDGDPVRSLCGLGEREPVLLGLLAGRPSVTAGAATGAPQLARTGQLAERVPSLAVTEAAPVRSRAGEEVMLTGATGFLGAHLLRGLLDRGRRVLCLVRATDREAALRRVRSNLERHGLWAAEDAARIIPVAGDLGDERALLELESAAAEGLAEVFHAASQVNWVEPLDELWEANVEGTRAVVELAARTGARLHHVSSTTVFPFGSGTVYGESDPLDHGGTLVGGYAQSKWIAERLAAAGRDRGLDVTVYRPGIISGSSVTGASNPRGFFESMVRGCAELGIAPVLDMDVDIVPVDFVAAGLVALAAGRAEGPLHLVNPQPVPYEEMMRSIRRQGHEIRELDYEAWREEVLNDDRLHNCALAPFAEYLLYADAERMTLPKIRCDRTLAGLAGTGVSCPPLDDELLGTYLDHLLAGVATADRAIARSSR